MSTPLTVFVRILGERAAQTNAPTQICFPRTAYKASHRVDGVMDGVDGVVDSVVSSIRASSHDGEESSSDESLKLRKLEIFPPKIASYCLLNE